MDCPICMTYVENDIYSTFCGHLFCKNCIDKMKSSQRCWTCGSSLNTSQIHKVYMPSSSSRADLSSINESIKKLLKNDEEIIKRIKALEEAKKPENVILIIDE